MINPIQTNKPAEARSAPRPCSPSTIQEILDADTGDSSLIFNLANHGRKMEGLLKRIEAVACGREQPPEEYLDDTDALRWVWEQIQNFKANTD